MDSLIDLSNDNGHTMRHEIQPISFISFQFFNNENGLFLLSCHVPSKEMDLFLFICTQH